MPVPLFCGRTRLFTRPNKEIVVIAVVAPFDVDQSSNGGRVRRMIGRFSAQLLAADNFSGEQVVRIGPALGHVQQAGA